jgi:hypothetical protein
MTLEKPVWLKEPCAADSSRPGARDLRIHHKNFRACRLDSCYTLDPRHVAGRLARAGQYDRITTTYLINMNVPCAGVMRSRPVGVGLPLLTPPRRKRVAGAPFAGAEKQPSAACPGAAGGGVADPRDSRHRFGHRAPRSLGTNRGRRRSRPLRAVLPAALIAPLKVGRRRLAWAAGTAPLVVPTTTRAS